jgi:hypothetical protein
VLGRGVAGWPAADSLNLLARREGAGTTWLQQCMLEVWYGNSLVDMKAMSACDKSSLDSSLSLRRVTGDSLSIPKPKLEE